MANGVHVNVNGTWQPVNEVGGTNRPYMNVNGTWVGASNVYVKVNSTWQEIYTYDATAPTVASITSSGLSNGKMRATWGAITDTESGVASAVLYAHALDKSGNYVALGAVYTIPSGSYSGGTYDYTVSTTYRPTTSDTRQARIAFSVLMTDAAGNSRTTYSNYAYTKPAPGTYAFPAIDSRTYSVSNGTWRTDANAYLVHGGYFSSTYGNQRGFYFFGSNGPAWLCNGYTPSSGGFVVVRSGSSGTSGTWYFAPHNYALKPATAGTLDTTKETSTAVSGADFATTVSMPASWLSGFAANTLKGWGVDYVSNSYIVLREYTSGFSGWVNLTFSD